MIIKSMVFSILLLSISPNIFSKSTEKMIINSTDGIKLTADYYKSKTKKSLGIILLCHQAGWSRGEYNETGPWLASLGFDAIAIDQRSGKEINNVKNLASIQAKGKNLATDYIAARPDIEAALKTLRTRFKKKIILVGSSYSAALSVRLAGEGNVHIRAVAAFSPGEYFANKQYLKEVMAKIKVPTFITASKSEIDKNLKLWKIAPEKNVTIFRPKSEGFHGSRALWTSKNGFQDYREEFKTFLNSL